MEIQINPKAGDLQIVNVVKNANSGDTLNVQSEHQFELAKRLLVQHKRVGLRVCLIDEDGYITRQISSRIREEHVQAGFNDRQLSVIRALERVLEHCHKEGVSLVGYSDQLVAIPSLLVHTEAAFEHAKELDDPGVFFCAGSISIKPDVAQ